MCVRLFDVRGTAAYHAFSCAVSTREAEATDVGTRLRAHVRTPVVSFEAGHQPDRRRCRAWVNQNAYGFQDGDLAVVLVARHLSTLFAFNDTIWAKYGGTITQRTNFNDPKTKQPPTINLFNSTGHGGALPNRGTTLDSLLKRGLHLAVCQMSTRGNAGGIAAASGGTAEAIYNELVANLVSRNAHMVPAGIVAVNRAQERGYSLATVG
jgi:hypothetical protein